MARCNCPHYNIPSADPNDSKGCPVHDPDYIDPNLSVRALRDAYRRLLEVTRKLVDEAEGNLLDQYEATPLEVSIRRTYAGKRGRLKRLAREAGVGK